MYDVSAILLAAGQSRRMGGDKLALTFGGVTLLDRALGLLTGLPVARRIVVLDAARAAWAQPPRDMRVVVNHHPERGQSASLRLGLAEAAGGGYLFLTADQPLLTRDAVGDLLRRWDGAHIVYPTVDGRPRSPALFPARFRGELMALTGDTGGRAVRAAHPEACLPLEAENGHLYWDVDTRTDYDKLLKMTDTFTR